MSADKMLNWSVMGIAALAFFSILWLVIRHHLA
jgi:hypothetical protein